MDSYDVIANAVIDYWKDNYPQDVIAFFQQKNSWDDKWERCEELVMCNGCDDYENMTFLSDFCEGQTEVKDVVIVPLREVTALYYEKKIAIPEIENFTNIGRIRAMTEEELAGLLRDYQCNTCDFNGFCDETEKCEKEILEWLKQEIKTN